MRKLIVLSAVASAFVALAAVGGAQATPASNLVGFSGNQQSSINTVGYRRNRHYRGNQGFRKLWWSPRRYKHRRRWN